MKFRPLTLLTLLLCAAAAAPSTALVHAQEVTQVVAQPAATPPQTLTMPPHNLMPVPMSVRFQAGRMPVTKSFAVYLQGQTDNRLRAYVERIKRRLEGRTVMELPHELASDASTAALVIECQTASKPVPTLGEDESYTLNVTDKQAVLKSPTTLGAMRGLETFLQLLEGERNGFFIPAVQIKDKPRFPWRGLLIDAARHFQPVEVIKRNLDGMAAVKLNVLHWHLTDDQGFRIESKRFPKLHETGSDGLYYTQTQAREIIEYAHARGIRVIPEFDVPGHATSWFVGYPEFASAPGPYEIERQPGVFNPSFDPTRDEVYKFLDKFLGEMAELFPDAYMHIGGDESTGRQWRLNPRIQAFMREKNLKDKHALQTYFNQRLLKIVTKHRKIMMGWDEILQPDLPKNVVIQSWRGQKALADAARQGFNGILSSGYYINLMHPASKHYAVDPIPADARLTEAEAAHILGGEATMWSEWVTPETIDSRIWSRTAAIAERFWSPRIVADADDMYRRLAVISVQLEELGLMHNKNQAMMLRRLAGNENSENIEALQLLASLVEPVKEYQRFDLRPQTMLSPLTGLNDAARPDSEAARKFNLMVDALLSDAPRFELFAPQLQKTLTSWRDAGIKLQVLIDKSSNLQEANPLAKDLAEMGTAGLEALSYIKQGVAPTSDWRAAKLAVIDEAAKPKSAAVEFPFIVSMRQLIFAAAQESQLKSMTPASWHNQIKQLAALPAKPAAK